MTRHCIHFFFFLLIVKHLLCTKSETFWIHLFHLVTSPYLGALCMNSSNWKGRWRIFFFIIIYLKWLLMASSDKKPHNCLLAHMSFSHFHSCFINHSLHRLNSKIKRKLTEVHPDADKIPEGVLLLIFTYSFIDFINVTNRRYMIKLPFHLFKAKETNNINILLCA